MGKKMSSPQIANRWTLLRNVSISCERYGMIIDVQKENKIQVNQKLKKS